MVSSFLVKATGTLGVDMSPKRTAFLCLALFVLVAAVVAGCGSGSSGTTGAGATTASSAMGTSGSAADGAAIFASNCTRCHGQDAKGGNGPDLTHETDQAKVVDHVTNGGQRMPPFGGQLSADQISAVVQYVLSLNGK